MSSRIMVINDTQEILELFEDLLTDEGYEVIVYSFGIQDMEEVVRAAPDLIILDLLMGGEQVGWQMLQKLKMRRSTANIPVVVCTAAIQQVREMEGFLHSKNVGLVLKPFEIDELLRVVHQTLEAYGRTSGSASRDEAAGNTNEQEAAGA